MRQILGDGEILKNSCQSGERILMSNFLKNNTAIGLYFAQDSSTLDRKFTSKLVDIYQQILSVSGNIPLLFDILYVWLYDLDKESFHEHYNNMSWKAIPYREQNSIILIARLNEYFNVQNTPTLIILNTSTGELITKNGYQVISQIGLNAIESWCSGEKAVCPTLSEEEFIWYYVSCDGGCGMSPLIGLRYHCEICENFDLCMACKESKGHEHELKLIKSSYETDDS